MEFALTKGMTPLQPDQSYVLVTTGTQIGEKVIETARMLTWLDTQEADPLKAMRDISSPLILLHQDPYSFDPTREDCRRLFREIITEGRGLTEQDLKNKVAELRV